MPGFGFGRGYSRSTRRRPGDSGSTTLLRQPDGTVDVISLTPTWTPVLTRQSDGTVAVSGNG